MKNSKTLGDDGIIIESIKKGGDALHRTLCKLVNACMVNGTTPTQWDRAVILILHKKGEI